VLDLEGLIAQIVAELLSASTAGSGSESSLSTLLCIEVAGKLAMWMCLSTALLVLLPNAILILLTEDSHKHQ